MYAIYIHIDNCQEHPDGYSDTVGLYDTEQEANDRLDAEIEWYKTETSMDASLWVAVYD